MWIYIIYIYNSLGYVIYINHIYHTYTSAYFIHRICLVLCVCLYNFYNKNKLSSCLTFGQVRPGCFIIQNEDPTSVTNDILQSVSSPPASCNSQLSDVESYVVAIHCGSRQHIPRQVMDIDRLNQDEELDDTPRVFRNQHQLMVVHSGKSWRIFDAMINNKMRPVVCAITGAVVPAELLMIARKGT